MARIMCIDFGGKRTGIAVSDPLQIIASVLETVATDKLLDYLTNYFKTEEVETLVVGLPMHLDGRPADIEVKILAFIKEVEKRFPHLKIERQDERFTSQDAKRIILEAGVKKKKRRDKGLVDRVSAVLILQDFMESI